TDASCASIVDRGLRSGKFIRAFDRHWLAGSMVRVWAADGHGAIESAFGLLHKNVLDRRIWTAR
ncbi:hypothetical protein ACFQ8A_41410, partial [Streptomyces erythrochromogenes]